jgi:carbonic anhydrase
MQLSAEECLARLRQGNDRFRQGRAERSGATPQRLAELAGGPQQPFAAVLACSDSRCPVEIIFDQGVGELFVVRVAGQAATAAVLGSIEYAVAVLKTPLVVVLGHTNCGAVAAAAGDEPLPANLAALAERIRPAAIKAGLQATPEPDADRWAAAVKENIWLAVEQLFTGSPGIARGVREGQCQVVGALLDLATGEVHWHGMHPLNDALKMH